MQRATLSIDTSLSLYNYVSQCPTDRHAAKSSLTICRLFHYCPSACLGVIDCTVAGESFQFIHTAIYQQ